jgi:hypothetical protein
MTRKEFRTIKVGDILLRQDASKHDDVSFLCKVNLISCNGIRYEPTESKCNFTLEYLKRNWDTSSISYCDLYHFYSKPKLKLKDFLND